MSTPKNAPRLVTGGADERPDTSDVTNKDQFFNEKTQSDSVGHARLSVFRSAVDPVPFASVILADLIGRIRSPELADITAEIAEAFAIAGGGKNGKNRIAEAKKKLPAVTLAGTFTRRAIVAWAGSSGLVQIDLDDLSPEALPTIKAKLKACPYVAILYVSPSGAGLKGAVLVPGLAMPDPARYLLAWQAVTRLLASLGLVNDPATKDCARLAFLAHDPDAYYNPEARVFPLDDWAEPEPALPKPNFPHLKS